MGFDGKKTPVSSSRRMPVLVQITVRTAEMHPHPSI
jgi:hypothetical protein